MTPITEKLKDFRKSSLKIYRQFENERYKKTVITVHMGICGKAMGAEEVFDMYENIINRNNFLQENIILEKAGCIGLCCWEPLIQIHKYGLPSFMYCQVTEDKAEAIFSQHVLNNVIIEPWLVSTKI